MIETEAGALRAVAGALDGEFERAVKMIVQCKGSVLATDGQRLHSRAAEVPVRSKVGAGDTFVGAFTLAHARGETLGAALTQGVAAASAAVMTEGTALCRREDVERLLELCPANAI